MDLSVGMKIHGTIAAILAGTPSLLVACDSSTRELAEYHNIQYVPSYKITEEFDLEDLIFKCNFSSVLDGHEQRFNSFCDSLKENGLQCAYNRNEKSAIEDILNNTQYFGGVQSILFCDNLEKAERLNNYYGYLNRKIKKLKK